MLQEGPVHAPRLIEPQYPPTEMASGGEGVLCEHVALSLLDHLGLVRQLFEEECPPKKAQEKDQGAGTYEMPQ